MTLLRTLGLALCAVIMLSACKKAPPESVPVIEAPAAPAAVTKAAAPAPVQEMAANFGKVFFEFDSATLDSGASGALSANAAIMAKSTDVKVEIQGHADERGTTDYNLSLGSSRAATVRKHLIAQGVSPSRLSTISYGEERPIDPGASEVAWSKNRRAEFRITWGQGSVRGTTE